MTTNPFDGTDFPVERPTSVQALGELVRHASTTNQALYPFGGQTQLDLGCPPTKPGLAIDLRGLDQVIDFPARDMTITVQAGMTGARLQEIVRAENLRLPIDVPHADRATVGGILATNISGPRRFGFGTLRDYLLGFSAINDEGNEFKAGGRVVKNVAGYDLCKLMIGSLGTLGILTQATFKLRPVPEEQALVTVEIGDRDLESTLNHLHATRTLPVVLDVYHRVAAQWLFGQADASMADAPWVLFAGFEGNGEAVHWQLQQLVRELGPAVALQARVGFPGKPLWNALAEFPGLEEARLSLKASLLPSQLADFLRQAAADPARPLLAAHAGNGIVLGHFVGDLGQERARAIVTSWRQRASVVVQRAPAAWRDADFVWGPPGANGDLMRRIKAKFDPRGIFNPGRFVAQI